MNNILIEDEKIRLSSSDFNEELTVNFMILNDEIVSVDKNNLCKIVSTTNCFNLHELLIAEDCKQIEDIFRRLVKSFKGEKVSINIKTPIFVSDNINKIIESIKSIDNVESISIVEGKELIRGYKKIINKYKSIAIRIIKCFGGRYSIETEKERIKRQDIKELLEKNLERLKAGERDLYL